MSDQPSVDKATPAYAVNRKRSISAVWLLPLFAVILGGWLAYKHFTEAGVNIVITFPSGEGMVAGKTEVRYKGITVGTVTELNVQPDLNSVAAYVTMSRHTETVLRENTRFWLVKPELSFAGVQGLDTLITGNYIAMRPGESGSRRFVFKALNEAPPPEPGAGDLQFSIISNDVGSLHAGSPIHYRKMQVGKIVDYALSEDRNHVIFQAHIHSDYTDLLHEKSRFWNTSGISISGDLNSVEFDTDSLASIILGGISFDNPANQDPGEAAQNGSVFTLHENYAKARTGILIDVEFSTAEGLRTDHTEVRYKGITVGKIISLDMKDDFSGVVASISIDPLAEIKLNESTDFWLSQPQISLSRISGLSTLLTGSHIDMRFQPDSDSAQRVSFKALPEAPPPTKNKPGLYITLLAKELEGIGRDSEIYFRNVSIGRVIDYRLNEQRDQVLIDVHIPPRFAELISEDARFYQSSGVKLEASLQGITVNSESLASILRGGIGLYLPEGAASNTQVENHQNFVLYKSLEAASVKGIDIEIYFSESNNLKAGADIRYLGVNIGKVERVSLNHPESGVTVHAILEPKASAFATADSSFWRVKPQFSLAGVANLSTLVFGEYLAAEPGSGVGRQHTFVGKQFPPEENPSHQGLSLKLQASSLASLKEGKTVFYREIPVGEIRGFELAEDARHVNIYVHIDPAYTTLVRSNSVFWNTTGIDFDFSWFSGAKLRTGSVQSLIAGGIAFATPTEAGQEITNGQVFTLHEAPKEEWLKWQPSLPWGKEP
ncbi:MAG TPA: MlaD family protein [Cellvibrionaceae bacterium]